MKRALLGLACGVAVATVMAGPASAAHNGNNRAELTGTGDADAVGTAVVNYSEGRSDFNGTITVSNLVADGTYSFFVRRGTTETVVCTGTASSEGVFTCNEQHLELPGFTTAVVRDSTGVEVASGTFARRGNCRDPEQAGSQCQAQN